MPFWKMESPFVDKDDQGKGTMERRRKKSFYWYKKVIASGGSDLD